MLLFWSLVTFFTLPMLVIHTVVFFPSSLSTFLHLRNKAVNLSFCWEDFLRLVVGWILRWCKMCWVGKVASACLPFIGGSPIAAVVVAYLWHPAVGTHSHRSEDTGRSVGTVVIHWSTGTMCVLLPCQMKSVTTCSWWIKYVIKSFPQYKRMSSGETLPYSYQMTENVRF